MHGVHVPRAGLDAIDREVAFRVGDRRRRNEIAELDRQRDARAGHGRLILVAAHRAGERRGRTKLNDERRLDALGEERAGAIAFARIKRGLFRRRVRDLERAVFAAARGSAGVAADDRAGDTAPGGIDDTAANRRSRFQRDVELEVAAIAVAERAIGVSVVRMNHRDAIQARYRIGQRRFVIAVRIGARDHGVADDDERGGDAFAVRGHASAARGGFSKDERAGVFAVREVALVKLAARGVHHQIDDRIRLRVDAERAAVIRLDGVEPLRLRLLRQQPRGYAIVRLERAHADAHAAQRLAVLVEHASGDDCMQRQREEEEQRGGQGSASSHSANSTLPYLRATSDGVIPSLPFALRSAPCASSSFAISMSPRLAAPCKGV